MKIVNGSEENKVKKSYKEKNRGNNEKRPFVSKKNFIDDPAYLGRSKKIIFFKK